MLILISRILSVLGVVVICMLLVVSEYLPCLAIANQKS